ncbi:hypothetical protein BS47DRAFT_1364249 [Hydnum rufescens UP504]|uniref:Uncharacterized protein n=1 Tax=Hydnum rufescens UP504 TaxID=1448309 RepID=A0A9P6ASV6_9AGAM|nr:hypothetical protein BS47DRAFT_1364249 [Hydnum rufescens UP504]
MKPAFSSPPDEEHDETSEVDVADYGDWVDEPAAEEDFVERGMKVPVSALDACHESFTAADEARQKASTAIFADTVSWLFSTPGEAQYYALALLDELFKGLPPCAMVGVLYDVSCQLHRSIVKAVSAFGALFVNSFLASQRCQVSGQLGNWLLNKWTRVTRRLKGANAVLDECPVDRVTLKSQWKLQRKQQHLPHPWQSKLHGVRMVQRILDLRVARAELNTRRNAVKTSLQTCAPNTQHHSGLLLALDTLTAELRAANRNLERHEAMLGHRRLRDKLHARKFEEGRLRADYQPFNTGMSILTYQRVHAQVSEALKRCGGAFKTLANKINALINEMVVLKESAPVPGFAAIPSCVDVAQIWDMAHGALYEDWDMTLDEDVIPAWLCDGDTRRGIAAMVDRKRCQEEKR